MGYINYSMSERAAGAYETGLMPRSKWDKAAILDYIADRRQSWPGIDGKKMNALKYASAHALKCLLTSSEWHHTGKLYRQTDFYAPDLEWINNTDIAALVHYLNQHAKPQKKAITEYRAQCVYIEWAGTRAHPKPIKHTAAGVIRGGWFYPDGQTFKKSIYANGFEIIEKL